MEFSLYGTAVKLTTQRQMDRFQEGGFTALIVADDDIKARIQLDIRAGEATVVFDDNARDIQVNSPTQACNYADSFS